MLKVYVMSHIMHVFILHADPYLIGSYVFMPHVNVIMAYEHVDVRMSNLVTSPTRVAQKSLKQGRANTAPAREPSRNFGGQGGRGDRQHAKNGC